MCPTCRGYAEVVRIRQPHEYFDLLRQIRTLLQEGTLQLESGNCALDEVQKDKAWPCDHIEHEFSCCSCGQHFRLGVETYHGSGGLWEAVPPANPNGAA